jgi:3-oxoacid CoA-transferase subunit B
VVQRIITDLTVIDVLPDCAGLLLRELAPGVSADEVRAATGTPLELADDVSEMLRPESIRKP